jgi:hypothetical protein
MIYFSLASSSYRWLWVNRFQVLKLIFPVILVIFLTSFISNIAIIFVIYLFGLWLVSSCMVRLHRFILLDESSVSYLSKPNKKDFIYLGIWLIVTFIENLLGEVTGSIAISYPFAALPLLLFFSVLGIYIFTRIYMIFPSISVRKNLSFAWGLTNKKGRDLQVVFSLLIFLTPWLACFVILFYFFNPPIFTIWILVFLNFFIVNTHYSLLFKSFTIRRDK